MTGLRFGSSIDGPIETPARLGARIRAVDLHAAGEPGRVILGGVEDVPGATMFDKMTWLAANHDDLRRRMVHEPRGFPAANCNLVLPSSNPEAVAGYVIMEQVEYPGMSGTNTMCVVTALLETGALPMIEPVTELTLESPAGLIRIRADCRDGKVTGVTLRNVPCVCNAPGRAGGGPAPRHRHRRRGVRRDVLRHRLGRAVRPATRRRTRAPTSRGSPR